MVIRSCSAVSSCGGAGVAVPGSWRRLAGLGGALAGVLLLGAGCEPVSEGGYDEPYAVPEPAHPAMRAPPSASGTEALDPHGHGGLAGGQSGLPPGHPPLPASGSAPPPAPVSAGESAGEMEVLGLRAVVPEGWVRETPSSRLRLAQFRLLRAEGDEHDGELTLIEAGGSVEDNIRRWESQFEGAPRAVTEEREVGGLQVTLVAIDGTFLYKERPMAPGPGTPRPGYKLLGGVVQAPGGQLFLKAFGPGATMEKWRASFETFVGSLRLGR